RRKKTPVTLRRHRQREGSLELGRGRKPSERKTAKRKAGKKVTPYTELGCIVRRCIDSHSRLQRSRSANMVSVNRRMVSLSSAHSSCCWQVVRCSKESLSQRRFDSRWLMGLTPLTGIITAYMNVPQEMQDACRGSRNYRTFSSSHCEARSSVISVRSAPCS